MSCTIRNGKLEIVQGADRVFQFQDSSTTDYTGASAVTFDIWQGNIGGTSLLSKTLSDVSFVNAYTLSLSVTNTESATMPAGTHWFELWITLSGGEKRCPLLGRFKVIDARKQDA